jgi:hypothetical protein
MAVIAGLLFGASRAAIGRPEVGLVELQPHRVGIDLSFNGANIEVHAVVPEQDEAAIRLMGAPQRQDLKRLGKKGGVLWMSAGDVRLEDVPAVYQVLSTKPLADLAPPATLAAYKLGYSLLIPVRPRDAEVRAEFVRLKEHEGLYAMREQGLVATESTLPAHSSLLNRATQAKNPAGFTGRPRLLRGVFKLPARTPAGKYRVDVIGFNDGQAEHLATTTLLFEHVGLARRLRRLAMNHGLAYGIVASLLAIIAGLLTGFLFRPKADEAH